MIIGSNGMAGHTIYNYLDTLNKYYLMNTARQKFNKDTLIVDVVEDINFLQRVIRNSQPDIIINCVGVLGKASEENRLYAIAINACFPHVLVDFTKDMKTKIIHISTDCVFDGIQGKYFETDKPTETNVYGKTKALGEIIDDKNLTLRLSIIGDELKKNGSGLFHWITTQSNMIVKGYTKALWSGITTLELAKQIDRIIDTNLTGLYHLAPADDISKYELLVKIIKIFQVSVIVNADNEFRQDKTLVNNRKKEYDPCIPDYETQLMEMKKFIERSK